MENFENRKNDDSDVESQNRPQREHEGEDTITSMNNQVFIKQIRKLKSLSDSKGSLTNTSTPTRSQEKQLNRSVSSATTDSVPTFFKGLFSKDKSPTDGEGDESLTGVIIESQPLIHQPTATNKELNKISQSKEFINQLKSTAQLINNGQFAAEAEQEPMGTNTNSNRKKGRRNQTDKVFDALSTIINQSSTDVTNEVEFINALKLIVKENERSQQKKKDKATWIWTVITFLVFCLMIVMVIIFTISVYSISNGFMKRLMAIEQSNMNALNSNGSNYTVV